MGRSTGHGSHGVQQQQQQQHRLSAAKHESSVGKQRGDSALARRVCELPANGSLEGGDCDDGASGIHPAATEICDADNTPYP